MRATAARSCKTKISTMWFDSYHACSKSLGQMSWYMDALFDETTGAYWQCWIFQRVMRHSKDLFMGASVDREEERNRTRQFFHDILSSKILVASFIAHEIYQRLAANGAEEA